MGGWRGGKGGGGGGYDWRQHTRASDDPAVQNACRELCERVMRAEPGYAEDVESWGAESRTYKRYCSQYGLSFSKTGRGWFRIEKLDPNAANPFAQMAEVLQSEAHGESMSTRDLLWIVKKNHPELWQQLGVKGVNNCSERKLIQNEDEVKRYFDVSSDWLTLSPKGCLEQAEYAKPVYLTAGEHGALVDKASSLIDRALHAVPWRDGDNQGSGKDLFCAFSEADCNPKRLERVLKQQASQVFRRMLSVRQRLPAYQKRVEVLQKCEACDVLVICGATGCGKTTQLPQLLMDAFAEQDNPSKIVCTQPRRISATSVAERVAHERGESIGESVGYQIRFEHRTSADTSLLYCTVGILLRHLTTSPTLEGIGVVIVDEVHERDVHTDFVLLVLRDLILGPRRGSLKLVLMSATIDAQGFINYFRDATLTEGTPGGLIVDYFEIPGKTNFPIEEYWIEDILEHLMPGYVPAGPPPPKKYAAPTKERNLWCTEPGALEEALGSKYTPDTCKRLQNVLRRPIGKADLSLVAEIVLHISQNEGPGAVLVFVPGWQDISDCIKELRGRERQVDWETWRIYPLHSMVPPAEQNLIFREMPECERKIIVSTNIAETSITVEDVVFVIDTGLIKGTTYTPKTNVATLEALQISRSNAQQRRGRAGRCQPGKFFKLYSSIEWEEIPDSMEPEMQRTPVEELCLQVKALELPGSVASVLGKAIDPPAPRAVSNAIFLLQSLNALTQDERLTPLGWKLALLPIHPSLGKMMLLGSLFDCVPELLTVCATLSSKSPFVMPFGKEKEADAAKKALGEGLPGDHLLFAKVLALWHKRPESRQKDQFCFQNFLSDKSLQQIEKTRQDLYKYVIDLKLRPAGSKLGPGDDKLHSAKCAELLCVLAASLPLATRPPSQRKFKCLEATHASCAVHPSSVMEQLSSPKRRMRDSGETFGVLCWFSRLKTAELYLHDVSMIADVLPILLLSPFVSQREGDLQVFEITAPCYEPQALEESCDGASDRGVSVEGDEEGDEEDLSLTPPPLLLRLSDEKLTNSLWLLRGKLNELVDRIIGQPPVKLPSEVANAFMALRTLLHASYNVHEQDAEACEAFGGEAENIQQHGQARKKSKGGGKHKGSGYPWWQHIRGKGRW